MIIILQVMELTTKKMVEEGASGSSENSGENWRFRSVSSEEISRILDWKHAKPTKQCTQFAIELFRKYCNVNYGLKEVDSLADHPDILNDYLGKFYAGIRTKEGEYYKTNSLVSIRFGIQRHYLQHSIDIINDVDFQSSGDLYKAMMKELKLAGKGKTDHHKCPITKPDLARLVRYFQQNIMKPAVLQEYIWFIIMLFLYRRGREGQRALSKTSYEVRRGKPDDPQLMWSEDDEKYAWKFEEPYEYIAQVGV